MTSLVEEAPAGLHSPQIATRRTLISSVRRRDAAFLIDTQSRSYELERFGATYISTLTFRGCLVAL